MANAAQYEKPFAIRDSAGNVIYESAALYLSGTIDVVNAEATLAINRGEAVVVDTTTVSASKGIVFARWDYSTAGTDAIPQTKFAGKRTPASANAAAGFLGVALETFVPGALGRVAAPGSMLSVKCTVTQIVCPALLAASATAGAVAVATAVHGGANGSILGTALQENTAAATTPVGTGSTSQVGCLISPA